MEREPVVVERSSGGVAAVAIVVLVIIAILAVFVISMVLTPSPDPMSMLIMALPLSLLYFGGILMCKYLPKRRSPYGEGYDPR